VTIRDVCDECERLRAPLYSTPEHRTCYHRIPEEPCS
jgi:hypothetical protein